MKYFFLIERALPNYVAYVPDLPGCVATGKNAADTRKAIKVAVEMHLKGFVADGLPIPIPTIQSDYVTLNTKTADFT